MRNVIAFILAAIMSVAIVFVASMLFFPSEDNNASKEDTEPAISLTVSQSDHREALYNFTFTLNDEEYSLPCKYRVFENNGWALRRPTEMIDASSNMTGIYMKKSGRSLEVEIINYSKSPIMCCNGQINTVSASVSDFGKIELRRAVTFDGTSSPDFIRQELGEPNEYDADDEKITLTYKKADYRKVQFVFYKKRTYENTGDLKNDGNIYMPPLESGYFDQVVIIQCRNDG